MTKTVLLSSEHHKNLRVKTSYSEELGDAVMWAPTFASEFRSIQAYYPIVFQKDSVTGRLFPVALFGLETGENLFIREGKWNAGYIPLMMQRIPFSIGMYDADEGAEKGAEKKRLLHVDLDHPKVSTTDGMPLFGEHGGITEYLERVSGMLEAIHIWSEHNEKFMAALTELELLEPVTMEITLTDGGKGQLMGFYTIKEDALEKLAADKVQLLHEQGYLQAIYMAIASLSNVRSLIERKSAHVSNP